MFYKGQPWEQMPGFFLVPNCAIPYTFPAGTFSEIVTVDKPLTLNSWWEAWIQLSTVGRDLVHSGHRCRPETKNTVFTAFQQKTFTQDIPSV